MRSRIAVLIPVYNNWSGLRVSLQSLGRQSEPCDVIIVDDGSSSPVNEAACRSEYAKSTVLHQEQNAGIVSALNKGLAFIRGQGYLYIARLDAGDQCVPSRIQQQAAFLDQQREIMLVGSDTGFVNPSGDVIFVQRGPHEWGDIRRKMHLNSCFSHPSVMIRSEIFERVGVYKHEDVCAEDYGLFFRIAKSHPVANLPEMLTLAELNPNGLSLRRRRQQLRSRLRIQMQNFEVGVVESYIGIIKTLALMVTPSRVSVTLKRKLFAASC